MSGRAAQVDSARAPRRAAWWALGAVLVGAAALGAWQLYRLIDPAISVQAATGDCDLQAGACRVDLGGGASLALELAPRPIKPLVPIQVLARIQGLQPDSVALDLVGLDMYMGFNRPTLAHSQGGDYAGRLVLPVCSNRRMRWQARLLIEHQGRLISAPFEFSTEAS